MTERMCPFVAVQAVAMLVIAAGSLAASAGSRPVPALGSMRAG